ncbi:KilA, /APSES-type HTH DNA-binding domain [Moraxella macacae 0408225]|uniref:KilA, /APSES-type HTH DNA-binding domain n=1 Tax=Moraxella macacae 0408225 TaxID=1230338 RepID=L2F746_9GAMM|nr:KilA-N domain-containing protein [Moraxella macacae]ELA08725.1 KilA, /APSES-type HTH DNA-binding domain [Moraxella macacae 0408225]
MTNLVIANQAISTHNGLYSLNDLHKASGGADKHRPAFFLRNQETKELIAEVEQNSNCADLHSLKINQIAVITKEGTKGGTFVCRELVYRYAMWISAKFSLMVIRAFDALNTGAIPCLSSKNHYHSTVNHITIIPPAIGKEFIVRIQDDGTWAMRELGGDEYILNMKQVEAGHLPYGLAKLDIVQKAFLLEALTANFSRTIVNQMINRKNVAGFLE